MHAFDAFGGDGQDPQGAPFVDSAGNVYGATYYDNILHNGTIYKVDPAGQYSLLYTFASGGGEANNPKGGGLLMDAAGNLWGTAYWGGAHAQGAVFKIDRAGTVQTVYSFGSIPHDGQSPQGSLALDSAGNVYGTTGLGGSSDTGTLFKITASGVFSVLHSFVSASDGDSPQAGLVVDRMGNLYGTTSGGGPNGGGTVFKFD